MRPYPRALRLEILAAYDGGETAESLRARYGVAVSALREWVKLRAATGDVLARHGGGAPRSLDAAAVQLLLALRERYPDASMAELAEHLSSRGVRVSGKTLGRYLKSAGFVRHAVKSSAKAALSAKDKASSGRRYRRSSPPPDTENRRAYPSDVTDVEWALLEPLLPPAKPGGRVATVSKREVVNAIFYVLRTGCQWRMLPHDFPPWKTVYDYFRRWRDSGVWENVNQSLREKVRQREGREKSPSAVIIDSQSVKTTEKGGHVAMTGQSA